MPLSDREQQILQQIEKGLLTEDPELATFDVEDRSSAGRRIKLGALLFIVGIGFLVAFFATSWLIFGLASFVAMVGGIVLIAAAVKDLASQGFRDFGARRGWSDIIGDWEGKLRDRYRR